MVTAPAVHHGGKELVHELLILRDVCGLGRGWFARRDLAPGTELWKEKPITTGRNRSDLVRRVEADLEKHAAFCRPQDTTEISEAEGIVRCNYFDNGSCIGAMLFEQTSLLNHSCCPNASVRMMISEYGACYSRVIVAKHVAAGQQVFISYSAAKLFRPREERPCACWGFPRACLRCEGTLPPEEQELWALLEAAAFAADTARAVTPRTVDAAMLALPLQVCAAEAVSILLPSLVEGERFAEDIEFFRLKRSET